jgi:hypothetical protein
MPIPPDLTHLLGDFVEKIPNDLVNVLPLQCTVEHHIDLEHRLQPLISPYRLLGPKLEELKRQLINFIDVVFIHPSRSPYGDSELFYNKNDT